MIGSVEKGKIASVQSWELRADGDRFEEEAMNVESAEREES